MQKNLSLLLLLLTFNLLSQKIVAQNWQIVKKIGNANEDVANKIATDATGNMYVTGFFSGSLTIGTAQLISFGNKDIFIAKYDASGNVLWAVRAGSNGAEEGLGIAVDANENVYVTGAFSGTTTFGNLTVNSSGGTDIFIAKYTANGVISWVKRAGSTFDDKGNAITVDANGNCFVVGQFRGTVAFGTTNIISEGTSSIDIFISKLDTNGNFIFTTKAGGTGSDYGRGITVDNNGNCYITGDFTATATFGTTSLLTSGNADIFVAKLNSTGTHLWAKKAGRDNTDIGYGIGVDANANVYISGIYVGNAQFSNLTLASNNFQLDIFIAKYNTNGDIIWVKKAGGASNDHCNDLAVEPNGNSYITGYFPGTATFGTTSLVSIGAEDIYTSKIDSAGNFLWAIKAGGSGSDRGNSVTVTPNGKVLTTGIFNGTASFNGFSLLSSGSTDVFLTAISQQCIAPIITTQPLSKNVCAGTTTHLSVVASGTGTLNYQWKKGAVNIGSNNDTLTITNFSAADAASYTCEVTDTCGIVVSSSALLSFTSNITILQNLQTVKTCIGSNVTLNFIVSASGNMMTYSWYKNDVFINNNEALSIPVNATSDTGLYKCIASNGCDSKNSTALVSLNPSFVCNPNWVGANRITGSHNKYFSGTSVDSVGNVYVIGNFLQRIDFALNMSSLSLISNESDDICVAKYTPTGTVLWTRKIGGTNIDKGYSIKTDKQGNCYITGTFVSSTLNFGTVTLTSTGGYDCFIAKYDTNGNLLWAKKAGSTNIDESKSISIDAAGNCFVTGFFSGTFTADNLNITSANSINAFIAKYNTNGTIQWLKQMGGNSNDFGVGITTDKDGNSYVTGEFRESATFNTTTITAFGSGYESYVAKYDTDGNVIWVKSLANGFTIKTSAITIDSTGNIFVTGQFLDNATFGTTAVKSKGLEDIFIAKMNNNGTIEWVKTAGGKFSDIATGIGVDNTNNIHITGSLYDGGGSFEDIEFSKGGIFIAKYSTVGNLLLAVQLGNSYQDRPWGLAIDHLGNTIIAGAYLSNLPIGTFTLNRSDNLSQQSATDGFIIKFGTNNVLLPVDIISFKANLFEQEVRLNWLTANEINIQNYIVERSTNGTQFFAIDTVLANGNNNYSAIDHLSTTSVNQYFYRLKIVNNDGSKQYSYIVTVGLQKNNVTVQIYPNPVRDNLNINYQSIIQEKIIVKIYNLQTNLVYQNNFSAVQGSNLFILPINALTRGSYVLSIAGNNPQNILFIKQ